MNTPAMIKKVDFAEYEGKYDESVNDKLTTSPENLSVENMREKLHRTRRSQRFLKSPRRNSVRWMVQR